MDLRPEVEDYVVSAVAEIDKPARTKIVIHISASQIMPDETARVTDGLHNFSAYRAWAAHRNLRKLLRMGAVTFAIGIGFLFLCLSLREFIPTGPGDPVLSTISEGWVVVGWVAMWRPLEICLYDWWPIWREQKFMTTMSAIAVECRAVASI